MNYFKEQKINDDGNKKIFRAMARDAYIGFRRMVRRSANGFANLLIFVCPFLFLWLGIQSYASRGYFAIGGEWLGAFLYVLLIGILKSYASHANRGSSMPIPYQRFTQVSDDGEVSVDNGRLSEMLIFMADYEDWLERQGHRF